MARPLRSPCASVVVRGYARRVSRIVPEYAGLFQVTIRVPDADRAWCEESKQSFDDALQSMIDTGHGEAVGAMPATSVEQVGQWFELVLRWVNQPGDGPWDAAESIIESAKVVFPGLLTVTDDLTIDIQRQTRVGADIEITEDEAERLRVLGEGLVSPDAPPADWGA